MKSSVIKTTPPVGKRRWKHVSAGFGDRENLQDGLWVNSLNQGSE